MFDFNVVIRNMLQAALGRRGKRSRPAAATSALGEERRRTVASRGLGARNLKARVSGARTRLINKQHKQNVLHLSTQHEISKARTCLIYNKQHQSKVTSVLARYVRMELRRPRIRSTTCSSGPPGSCQVTSLSSCLARSRPGQGQLFFPF